MLSKTRSMPVDSPAPGVIPDTITGPVSNGSLVTGSDNPPLVVLPTRRSAARDRFDAERWLDEGGSFSSEAVTR